jgi:hypothetical protein
MTDSEIREQLIASIFAAWTRWGRARLDARARWKRLAWQVVLGITFSLKRTFVLQANRVAILARRAGGPAFSPRPAAG